MNTGWIDFVILSKHLSEFLIHRAPHSVDNVTNDREKTFAKIFLDLNSKNQLESCKPLLNLVRFGKVINILSRFNNCHWPSLRILCLQAHVVFIFHTLEGLDLACFELSSFHYFRQTLKKGFATLDNFANIHFLQLILLLNFSDSLIFRDKPCA